MRALVLTAVMVVVAGCPGPGGNGTGGGGGSNTGGGGFTNLGGGSGGGASGGGTGGGSGGGGGGATTGGGTGGATGGGTGGGTGGTGGGSGGAGTVNFDTFAFYRPVLISGADGVLHLAFHTNKSPSSVHYARCASDCGVGTNWSTTTVGTEEFIHSPRMVIGTDNRLHLLYDVSRTSGGPEFIYATCASNCAQSASWTKTNLASLLGGYWNSPDYGTPLVIDAQNRLSFIVRGNAGLTLGTCASGCGTLANWSSGTIRGFGARTALAVQGTTLHQLVDNAGTGPGDSLTYRTCASNCTQASSWQELAGSFVYDGEQPLGIAVTAQGGVRIVYNQGPSASTQPMNIKVQDDKLLTWGCDSNCLQIGSWSGFIAGAVGDGQRGLAMAEHGGGLVLSVSNDDRIFTRFCASNCLVDSNWQVADLDTATAVTAEFDPYAYTMASCGGQRALLATWHLSQGVVAIRPDGSAAFAHATSLLRTCPSSTAVVYLPGYGRLVYVP